MGKCENMNYYEISNNLYHNIILITFGCTTLFLLIWYWVISGKIAFLKIRTKSAHSEPVSVVICARNEYSNLEENLPHFLEQDYPEYEVVLVNDASDDDTFFLLKNFQLKYKHLKIINIEENVNFFKGKKFPLSIGILCAKHELLLLSDADCKPASLNWIREMAQKFDKDTEIVLGYGAYQKTKGLLNKLIRFDTLNVAMQYLGLAKSGMPYMGVGRNLAYRKSLFLRNKGFISHYKIQSGDDDLFVNQTAKASNTCIQISHDSHTYSEGKQSFAEWFRQKKRHLTTGKHYKTRHTFILGFYQMINILWWIALVSVLVIQYNLPAVGTLLFLKLGSQLLIAKRCMLKLNERGFLMMIPILELMMILIQPLIFLSGILRPTNRWK